MDDITQKFFDSPDAYSRAIQLLARYEDVENLSWERVEAYLSELDETDSQLLEKAIDHRTAIGKIHRHHNDEVNQLKRKVDTLLTVMEKSSIWNPELTEKLKTTAGASIQPSFEGGTPSLSQNPDSKTAELPSPAFIPEDEDDILLSVATERFIAFKERSVKAGTLVSVRSKLALLLKILSEHLEHDPKLSEISAPRMRHFRDTLMEIPAKRGALGKDVSVKAMLKMELPKISQKTAKDTTVLISEFVRWMEAESYPLQQGLVGVLSLIKSPKNKDKKIRINFTDEDLHRLYLSNNYCNGLWKRPSEYWIPLIALFTGARLGEIAQLLCSDIFESEGIWIFDFNEDDEGKQLKSETSKRRVPIHSTLLSLGLLDFLNARRKSSVQLFPEEPRTKEGRFDAYSKRFKRYKDKIGVVPPAGKLLDFHSYRHTIRTLLTNASVQELLIDDIVGHSSQERSIGRKTYTHTQLVPQKKEAIEKVAFDLDFYKIKPWDQFRFARALK